jgi:tetratricopeptide (TPR) repeat protein
MPKTTATPLPERVARARRENRTQQALELAHQLYKQVPTAEHRELLRQVAFERGNQLHQQGHTRDAAVVFANALAMGGPAEYQATLAERLAECGDPARALQAIPPDADPKLRQRVINHVADGAVRHGPAGKVSLPADLHAGFDAVLQAFAHAEAGRDDETRAALQTIGLTSPFLEWKLLVRGLLAYYAHDDARALENWQRLDPHRIPARLAAPLRLGIDPSFRRAQPATTQNALAQQAARLCGPSGATRLTELRKALGNVRSLANAFRQAEAVIAELRDRPRLVQRVAHCFFWAIVRHGLPEDLSRYQRVFGRVASEVDVARLHALALDERGMWPEAHDAWQRLLSALPNSTDWSGEIGRRAQAVIWEHMGHNAAAQDQESHKELPYLLQQHFEKPKPLKPGAATCFERSIALAPDRLDAYLALFRLHHLEGRIAQARKVGEKLLAQFPQHAETSEALGDLLLETREPAKARDYFAKALAANPLVHRLRAKLARARQNLGLELTLAGKFDAARAEYEAALALHEGPPALLLCQWAVLEMKAGQTERAAELIARAEQSPGQRLAVRYALVSESTRAKLTPAQRKGITTDLTQALAEAATPSEVLALLEAAADQRQRKLDAFRGQKTHEKTFLRFLDKLPLAEFTEAELERLCAHLAALDARRPLQRCLDVAERRYPENPEFVLARLDYHLNNRDSVGAGWQLTSMLDHARRLVQQLPREAQERYLPTLKERQEQVEAVTGAQVSPFNMLDEIFDRFGEAEGFDDDDGW